MASVWAELKRRNVVKVAVAYAIVACQAEIGRHVILNCGELIGHDSVVQDFVTVSPGANIAGVVTIGTGAYIGMGAVVLDRIHIGAGAIIGAGAVVTRDVPAGIKVMGIPARRC